MTNKKNWLEEGGNRRACIAGKFVKN
jgi:hypothetical protein